MLCQDPCGRCAAGVWSKDGRSHDAYMRRHSSEASQVAMRRVELIVPQETTKYSEASICWKIRMTKRVYSVPV